LLGQCDFGHGRILVSVFDFILLVFGVAQSLQVHATRIKLQRPKIWKRVLGLDLCASFHVIDPYLQGHGVSTPLQKVAPQRNGILSRVHGMDPSRWNVHGLTGCQSHSHDITDIFGVLFYHWNLFMAPPLPFLLLQDAAGHQIGKEHTLLTGQTEPRLVMGQVAWRRFEQHQFRGAPQHVVPHRAPPRVDMKIRVGAFDRGQTVVLHGRVVSFHQGWQRLGPSRRTRWNNSSSIGRLPWPGPGTIDPVQVPHKPGCPYQRFQRRAGEFRGDLMEEAGFLQHLVAPWYPRYLGNGHVRVGRCEHHLISASMSVVFKVFHQPLEVPVPRFFLRGHVDHLDPCGGSQNLSQVPDGNGIVIGAMGLPSHGYCHGRVVWCGVMRRKK
jgi:hypothetical protein